MIRALTRNPIGAKFTQQLRQIAEITGLFVTIPRHDTTIIEILGYVYYSDEGVGVRKYHANPDVAHANQELAIFGIEGFLQDHEGISIYEVDDSTGYILVSDQQANEFHIFKREGEPGNPHLHTLVKVVKVSTNESDGSDVTSVALNEQFPKGLFVAMSDDKTFHYYSWEDIAGNDLNSAGD